MKDLFNQTYHRSEKPNKVRAKKHLGQHFLTDENIASQIVRSFVEKCKTSAVLEIGPGMGILTKYLLEENAFKTYAVDVDRESVIWLKEHFPQLDKTLIEGDFLKLDLAKLFDHTFSLIGNFPYNISSQIVFKVLENKNRIPLMVGMFQKEVAERFCASPKSKEYGILSILTQAYYETEYLFTVNENVFNPPPKVKSGVIRLTRKEIDPDVNEKALYKVVKVAFNQRRKKLRNALHLFAIPDDVLKATGFIDKRAEELSVGDFIMLTNLIRDREIQ